MIHMGYPNTGTTTFDVDSGYEAESARIWEELEQEKEVDLFPVIQNMDDALFYIDQGISKLNRGVKLAKGTPYEDRISSLVMELEDVFSYIENEIAYIRKEEGV